MTIPGHHGGPAYAGTGDATVAGLADQIVATLRAQGIDQAHVAGFSLGGWLSIELARRRFARSVIAFSPAGGWRDCLV
jgi:pimeloyl-ACP methyl ester carboxylesterase